MLSSAVEGLLRGGRVQVLRYGGALIVMTLILPAVAAETTVALLIDDRDAAQVLVTRGGRTQPYDPRVGFQRCDQVRLREPRAGGPPVRAITTHHQIVEITVSDRSLDCELRAAPIALWPALKTAFTEVARRTRVQAVSPRDGVCPGKAEDVPPLDIPLLPASANSKLSAGRVRFHLEWTPLYSPYSLKFVRKEDGAAVIDAKGLVSNFFEQDGVDLRPGVYELHLADRCGRSVHDDHVDVVNTRPPEPPAGLSDLPEPGRTLFYADWLTTSNDGVWALQAMQIVAAVEPRTPATTSWIRQWSNRP